MTIAQWLDLQPTTEQVKDGYTREPGTEESEGYKALILGLFDGVEKMKHASLITDAIGALYTAHPHYAITVLRHIEQELSKDFMLSQLPSSLKALLCMILEDDDQ